MFKENTLFVIGAGASNEFGLPVGVELSAQIERNSLVVPGRFGGATTKNYAVWELITRKYGETETQRECLGALRRIHEGIYMASSIDRYIEMHSHDLRIAEMGKWQIAHAISTAERKSKIFFDIRKAEPKLSLPNLRKTWIHSFAQILIEKKNSEDVHTIGDEITIICFNYDRCIEYYLIEVIRQTFHDLTYSDAYGIVENINIIHPYGTLGKLPASLRHPGNNEVPFGRDLDNHLDIWLVKDNLKTFTEQGEDEEAMAKIKIAVTRARQIVFLGFSFEPLNMKLMRLADADILSHYQNCYSTGKGIEKQEIREISNRILDLMKRNKAIANKHDFIKIEHAASCKELFSLHWRNLSAA